MNRPIRTIASLVLSTAILAGCATKGELRRGLNEQRDALANERAERLAGQEQLAGDIGALRTELAGLRTDFGAQIAALEEGLQVMLPVTFAFDDTEIGPDQHEILDRFARVVQRFYPNARVTVQGFADPAGPRAYNQRLSQRRAEEVRTYLVSRGLSDDQLRAIGLGSTNPVIPGAAGDREGAELNRRVAFVIEGAAPVGVASSTARRR